MRKSKTVEEIAMVIDGDKDVGGAQEDARMSETTRRKNIRKAYLTSYTHYTFEVLIPAEHRSSTAKQS